MAAERELVQDALAALPPARTLDVACGTGWMTQHLPGEIVGIDASESMLEIARERVPDGRVPRRRCARRFRSRTRSFDRLVTGHFYGHLEEPERSRFLAEARRVARGARRRRLGAPRRCPAAEEWQERVLNDGSRWEVFKRYFTGEELAAELGGGEVYFAGNWFVAVRSAA